MKTARHITLPRLALAALLTVAAVGTGSAQNYPTTLLSHGPITYWRFNETTVSPPLNIVANASALGPIANGYAVANVTNGLPGIVGTCLAFSNPGDTVGNLGSKVDVPWNAALNPVPPFSVEFWAKPTSISTDSTGVSPLENFDPNFSGGSRAGWLFYENNSRWEWRIGNRGGYAGIIDGTNAGAMKPTAGVWQHIVGTWNGATAYVYVNGTLVGSNAVAVANWVNNPQSFIRMGGSPLTGTGGEGPYYSATSENGNRGYDGLLDEVAIYSNVLSPSTIMAHYAAATTNNAGYHQQILSDSHNVPQGYWELDDAVVTPPLPGALPIAINTGSLGTAANATNEWGVLAGQHGPGYAGFGAGSGSIFLDGDNGYVQVLDAPGLHFGTGFITMAAWVKPTEKDFFRNIIDHGFDGNDDETYLRISRGPGTDGTGDGNYYEAGSSDGGQVYGYDSALAPIPPGDIGNWVFIVGTFDGENWNLYRNGVLAAQTVATPGDIGNFDIPGPWTIGSRQDYPKDPEFLGQLESFGGNLAEVAIFTNTLSASDIAALYAAAQATPVLTQPVVNPGLVFQGSTVVLSGLADGSPPLSYLWTSNGVSTGVTTTNFTLPNLAVGTYTYALVVSNPFGTNTNSVTFTVVLAPPSITVQPTPATRFVGYPFSFSVAATGSTPLTYIWKLGSTIVQSGSSPTYTGVASLANAGIYTVIVSNVVTTATSTPVALTVNSVPAGYSTAVIATGPIDYYLMNETSGTVCHDSVGGNDGVYNSVTLGQPGFSVVDPDKAVAFSGVNSYAGNISGTAINFTGHTNFTLEAWVNAPAGLPDQSSIIAKGIGNNGTDETEQFSLDVVGGVYRFFTAGNADAIYATTATEGPNGSWQYIVGVYDDLNVLGGGAQMYIYVNGNLEGVAATRPAGLNNTLSPVSIGSKRTGNDPSYDGTFDGLVDEVAIYNQALSQSTIQNHYGAAYGPSLAPAISLPPVSYTNYAGLSASFTVGAYGSVPLSYQWNHNNSPLSGQTADSLTINPLALTDAGSYTCTVMNSISTVTSVPAILTVLSPPTNPPAIAGLVVHLPFNGDLLDASGRGNNATGYYSTTNSTNAAVPDATGGASNPYFYYAPDGVLGQALHYTTMAVTNGTGSTSIGTNDYYASLGVRSDLQFSSNVNFTVAYWIRLPLNYEGGDLPFFTDTAGSTFGAGFVFAPAYGYGTASPNPNPAPTSPGGWALSVFGTGGVGVGYYGALGSINDGGWHSLIHVFDRTLDTPVTYLDGLVATATKESGSTTLNATGTIDTGLPANIGQDPTGLYGETGAGDIEDLGVWRRAITPLEAASIYIAAVSNRLSYIGVPLTLTIQKTNTSQLVLKWPFGTLESSTNVVGPYSPLTNTSPFTTTASGVLKFYQVKD